METLKDLAIDVVVLVGTWFFVTFCGMMGHVNGLFSCSGEAHQTAQVEEAGSP